ncbi:MAG: flagellar FliJ family protein [Candidatus Margulisiibacteriota bacterium]
MKKFVFNLQRLLTLKEQKGDLLRQELSRLVFKRGQHEHVKFYYENSMATVFDKMRNQTQFSGEDREQSERHVSSIRDEIYRQKIILQEYDLKIEKKRQEIIENRKEVKTMERLREQKLEEYRYEVMVDERRLMDEIATRRPLRVMGE